MKRNRIKQSVWLTVAILMLSVLLATSLMTVSAFAETSDSEGHTLFIYCYFDVTQDDELGAVEGFLEEKQNVPAGTYLDVDELVHSLYANVAVKPTVLPEGGSIDDYWPGDISTIQNYPADGLMPDSDITIIVPLVYMPNEITWMDDEGNVLAVTHAATGDTPVWPETTNPTKASTAEFSYEFAGWTPSLGPVSSDMTYIARFTQVPRKYVVTWDVDGVLTEEEYAYGETPTFKGSTDKAADAQYTYTFDGWDNELATVTGDATYTAQYTQTVNKYTITWVVDGVTTTETYEYGQTPSFKDSTDKAANAQYTYTFDGWDNELATVTGDATYTAQYTQTVNKYTITFVDGNGNVVQSDEVEYDQLPEYTGETPTKDATPKYTYTFTGWDVEVSTVTGQATYTAQFSETINKYTITFVDGNGNVVQSDAVEYDQLPEYTGETPTKTATPKYTYTFTGWDVEVSTVTGQATYTAQFSETINKYTITFVDGNGNVVQSDEVEYDQLPEYTGETPTKDATPKYTYTFTGWDVEVSTVTGQATYTAQFSETINKYTITFVDGNGNVVQSDEVEYDQLPEYTGETPTKDATPKYTYTFTGWDVEVSTVTGQATYTAQFSETINKYTVTWIVDGKTTTETYEYGETPSFKGSTDKAADVQYTYTFEGWDKIVTAVTGDTVYTATYSKVLNEYRVTFEDYDGKQITKTLPYGTVIASHIPDDPVRPATAQYTYTFTGWGVEDGATVIGNVIYKAQYDSTVNTYTVTWIVDGVTTTETYKYGDTPSFKGSTDKAADAQYTYTFKDWDVEIVAVYGDATYTAEYDSTVNTYTVTWIVDGVTTTETYEYGQTPSFKGSTDKAANVQFTYTFKGWDNDVVAVTGDVTYTAEYTATLNKYTVVFQNYDRSEVGSVTLDYGTKIADHVPAAPTRPATVQYVYTFAGWGIEDGTTVTGDVTYVAQYDSALQKYTVTWIVDGKVTRETYEYGTVPTYSENTDKAPTAQYSYEFKGWNKPVVAVVGNATYIAHYRTTVNYYTVIWDVDGKKTTETYKYGEMPTFKGSTDKAATEKYNYVFKGWNNTVTPADSNVTYVAQYKTELNTFTVTWIVGDQTITETYKYGEMPAFKGATDKAATAQYTYTFKGWDKTFAAVTADATYTAEYTTTTNKYTVIFEYGDGKTHTVEVEYGQAAQAPTDTDKTATETTLFTFDGWDVAFDHITADLTVKAKYTEAPVSIETEPVTDPVTDPSTTEPEPEKNDAWLWFVILLIVIAAVIAIILLRRKSEPDPVPVPASQPEITPEPVVVPPVKEEPHHVEIVDEVSVDTVDELMSDAEAVELLEEAHERGGKGKMGIVNLGLIAPHFQPGDTITLAELKAKGLIDAKFGRIKVLASKSLDKPLIIKADAFSMQAIKMITVTGGHAIKLVGDDKK